MPDEPTQDSFTFLTLQDEILEEYGLPDHPCPIRVSVFKGGLESGELEFSMLADECLAYFEQHPEHQLKISKLLVRLCYLAGVTAGQAGDDLQAQHYLAQAFAMQPKDVQIAANYALALSENNRLAESLGVYEQILSFLQDGNKGFSSHIWSEAVRINLMLGNHSRALELLEICIKEAPEEFGDDARALARELRDKIENG